MATTAIEWATDVWNPFTGCDRVSPGCAHCYAATLAASLKRKEQGRIDKALAAGKPRPKVRYQKDGDPKGSGPGFGFTVHWDKLEKPPSFTVGGRTFVNSMSDVFHEAAPRRAIDQVLAVCAMRPQTDFLILTKRPERMLDYFVTGRPWDRVSHQMYRFNRYGGRAAKVAHQELWPLPNVWLGVSIENRRFVHRADLLRQTPAAVRFISAEPLLGPLVGETQRGGQGVGDDAGDTSRNGSHPGPEDRTTEVAVAASSPGSTFGTGAPIGTLEPVRLSRSTPKPASLDLTDIDWLIVGGESGAKHRPIDPQWVRDLRDTVIGTGERCSNCDGAGGYERIAEDNGEPYPAVCDDCRCRGRHGGTAFFFKQWGGHTPKSGGRLLDGREYSEFPTLSSGQRAA